MQQFKCFGGKCAHNFFLISSKGFNSLAMQTLDGKAQLLICFKNFWKIVKFIAFYFQFCLKHYLTDDVFCLFLRAGLAGKDEIEFALCDLVMDGLWHMFAKIRRAQIHQLSKEERVSVDVVIVKKHINKVTSHLDDSLSYTPNSLGPTHYGILCQTSITDYDSSFTYLTL